MASTETQPMILMSHADLVELIETVAENAAFITGVDTEHQHDEHETMHFFEEDRDSDAPDMDFTDALKLLNRGWTVARRSWDEPGISFVDRLYRNFVTIEDLKANDWYVL